MNETMMTVRGNVVDTPTLRRTKNGLAVANFRVASTQRRWDREQAAWVDGDTLFVTVTAWRGLGENVARSVGKGHPVVVQGRYYQREYIKEEVSKTAYELDAVTVGHDLTRGTTEFRKNPANAGPQLEVDDGGAPLDVTHELVDGEVVPIEIDATTGEIRELAAV